MSTDIHIRLTEDQMRFIDRVMRITGYKSRSETIRFLLGFIKMIIESESYVFPKYFFNAVKKKYDEGNISR